jgi:hypothetical protein
MATLTLNSLSRICQITGKPYGKVTAAIEALELRPVALDDGTAKYSDEQVERIAEHLTKPQEAK